MPRTSNPSHEVFDADGNPMDIDALIRAKTLREEHEKHSKNLPPSDEHGFIAMTDPSDQVVSLSAKVTQECDKTWTIDSGCTRHIVYQDVWFESIHDSSGVITVGGRSKIPIKGVGTVVMEVINAQGLTQKVTLHDVLFAPDIQFNLLSVARAVQDGIKVSFDKRKCNMHPSGSNTKIVGELSPRTSLYQFRAEPTTTHVAAVANSGTESKLLLMHKRLGHPNFRLMQDMSKTDAVLDLKLGSIDLRDEPFCSSCVFAKSHRAPFPKKSPALRSRYPLQKIHTDICGPLPSKTLGGCQYFITFTDDYSRFTYVYCISKRSELYDCYERFRKEVTTLFRDEVNMMEFRANRHDPEVQILQADNAKEYEKLGRMIHSKYGTKAQFTNAYTPQQNGVAERKNRTIMEKARALLLDGDLPKQLWGEAINHACNLMNCTPSPVTWGKTPYELWFGRKPSATLFKVFGCKAYVHIHELYRDKLDPRAKLCMHVGVAAQKKGYRLLDLDENRIIYSRDVIFHETEFPKLAFLEKPKAKEGNPIEGQNTSSSQSDSVLESLRIPITHEEERAQAEQESNAPTLQAELPGLDDSTTEYVVIAGTKRTRTSTNTSVTKRQCTFPDESKEMMLDDPLDQEERRQRLQDVHSLLAARHTETPRTFEEAMNSPEAPQWTQAAGSEYQSLMENNTWTLVEPPSNRKIMTSRWVWTVKYNGNGEIDRYKARLVIRGFMQEYGIDYNEIFAPVIRMEVLRLLLTLGALMDYEIHQMDVKTAFLNGDIDVDIYMRQPEGFVVGGKEHLVCKLNKSLYGLKQAPRVWYHTFSEFLESLKFKRIIKDRCVFVGNFSGQICFIAVYVDDLLIIAPSTELVTKIKDALKRRFKMSDLGEAAYILGWSIVRNREQRSIFIHQEKYATTVLTRFNHLESAAVMVPLDPSARLSKDMSPKTQSEQAYMQTVPYREAVGSFMYLMMGTRPDLCNFLREVSQFMSDPGMAHWNAVKRGLKYLNGTRSYGLHLGGKENLHLLDRKQLLSGFTDADYANCIDTRRSVGGYLTLFCNSPISWMSRKDHTVVLSTTEAEYIALCHCVQEMLFLHLLVGEIGLVQTSPMQIHEDNQSCIKIASNPELHGRSKHIDIRYHFVQEKVERKEIIIDYCNTKEMIADIFTKALNKDQFCSLRERLRVKSNPYKVKG